MKLDLIMSKKTYNTIRQYQDQKQVFKVSPHFASLDLQIYGNKRKKLQDLRCESDNKEYINTMK